MPKNSNPRDFSVLSFLFKVAAPHKKWAAAGALLSAASVAAALLLTFLTEQLVARTAAGDLSPVTVWVFVLLVVASALIGGLSGIASGRLGAYAGRDLKRTIANKMMKADYRTVQDISSGDAISTMNSDCGQIAAFLSSDMFSLVTQILTAVCAFVYLLHLNPVLGLVSFAYTPIGMVLASKINRRMNLLYPVSSDQKGEALTAAEQVLASLPVIKSFRMEHKIMNKLDAVFESLYKTERQIKFWDSLLQPACLSVANTPNLIFFIVGGLFALSGKLELGAFIAITQLLGYIIPPTVMLPFMLNNLNRSAASMKRINKILNLPMADFKPQQLEQKTCHGVMSVAARNLSFAYTPDTPVLQDISFTINGPGITAFVGGSGSGKTTLLSLLSGLYRPSGGAVRINGRDISQMNDMEIGKWFSVLPQDIHLFSASILDNIRVGKEDADDFELINAAKATRIYDFAVQKEKGLETVIGDGGAALSGGQAQKLALARAYLKNAPIWLLDEPTSALDGASEADLHELLREIAKIHIVLVAAHRLSTIRLADRIIFIQNGTVSADGTWDELKRNADFIKTIHAVHHSEESEAISV